MTTTINIGSYNNQRNIIATFAACELTGSEKQIKWAKDIRADLSAAVSLQPDDRKLPQVMKAIEWIFGNVSDSKVYIDNRMSNGGNSSEREIVQAIQKIVGMDKLRELLGAA